MSREENNTDRLARWAGDHGQAVFGFLWGMVRNHDLAEELAQEVFYRACRGANRYSAMGQERGYLLAIADRLVRDRWRRPSREMTLEASTWEMIEPALAVPSPADPLEQEEDRRRLSAALDRLSEHQRRALLLRYYGDMPFAEIAEAMGLPLGTVLSHVRRGLAALRKVLHERNDLAENNELVETSDLPEKSRHED